MFKKVKWLSGISAAIVLSLGLLGFTAVSSQSAQDNQGYEIKPWVFNNGGGIAKSADYSTRASIGQAAIGVVSGNYTNQAGHIYASSLRIRVSNPSITGINPNSALNTGPVNVTIFGGNFKPGVLVKLTKAGLTDITATNVNVVASNKLTCTLDLSGARAEVCNIVATNPDGMSAVSRSCFYVINPTASPAFWERQEIGKSPTTSKGSMLGVTVGDGDNNGNVEVYAGCKDGGVYQFRWDGTKWDRQTIGTSAVSGGYMMSVAVSDGDNNDDLEVYAASNDGYVYQFRWDGTKWGRNIVGSSTAKSSGDMLSVAVGDGDNDGRLDVYAACKDKNIYQFRFDGTNWQRGVIGSGKNEMLSVVINDGDNDGKKEIYGSHKGGYMSQFVWTGNNWQARDINVPPVSTKDMYSVTAGDGDSDGRIEVYGANADGHVYQFVWTGTNWQAKDLVASPIPKPMDMLCAAIGDGNNDGSMEVYGVNKDGQVYQFKAINRLKVALITNKDTYGVAEPMKITISVTNNTAGTTTLNLPTSQLADFQIKDSQENNVYQWSKHQAFLQVLTDITLAPYETKTLLNTSWDQKDDHGLQVQGGKYCIDSWIVSGKTHSQIHALSKEVTISSPKGWTIPISAQIKGMTGSITCGAFSDATDGYDPYYNESPIPPASVDTTYLQIFFPHSEWNMNFDKFIRDIKGYNPGQKCVIWEFEVKTNAVNTDMALHLNTLNVPEEYTKVNLLDMDGDNSWDLRTTSGTITVNSGIEGHKRFKLVAMTEDELDRLDHLFNTGWNMMATPLQAVNSAPADVLGDDVETYYVYEWIDSHYQELDKKKGSIVPGKGYWLGLLGTTTIDVEGVKLTGTFSIPIKSGWNMIGCPFNSTSTVIMVEKNGERKTFAEAVRSGWVINALYTYKTGQYQAASGIEPWQGYWFPAIVDCSLLISNSSQQDTALKSSFYAPGSEKSENAWQVNLQVQAGSCKDTINNQPVFGVAQQAAAGLDLCDKIEPPTPPQGEYVSLFFTHPEEEIFDRFDWDIRSLMDDIMNEPIIWTFNVETNVSGEVVINWDNNSLPDGYNVILIDNGNGDREAGMGMKIDMHAANKYTYCTDYPKSPILASKAINQFQIIVSKAADAIQVSPASDLTRAYVYPNPAKESVTFAKLTSPARIQILTLAGELVRTLENNDNDDFVEWDLRNEGNEKIASGVYLYLITDDKGNKKVNKIAVIR